MRSGERLSAQLIDMGGVGFNVVVNGEERQIPVSDVAAIEFAGRLTGAGGRHARRPTAATQSGCETAT